MADLNLDLNLNHYTINELEDILNLNDYNYKDIQDNSIKIKNKIFSVTSLDEFKKNEIDRFLNDTVSRLERNFINNSLTLIDKKINNILNILQNDKKKDE